MRNKWTLLSIMGILLQPLFINSASLFETNLISRDTLYAWADGGLNIRTAGNVNAEILGSIPYGRSMLLLGYDSNGGVEQIQFYKASKKDSLINGIEFKCIDYFQKGWWIKVQYDNVIGFVFSGYTSRYKPIEGEIGIPGWIKQSAKLISDTEFYDKKSDCTDKYQYFEHGISIIGKSSNSGSWTYVIPNMSLEEAMLLTRKRIQSRMEEVLPIGKSCLNEKIGDEQSGIVTYKVSDNMGWSMTITWTYNGIIICEAFWC